MKFEEIAKLGVSRLERVRVRSALNPIIWLSVATAIISWSAAWFFQNDPAITALLIATGCLPIFAAVAAYFILLFKSPDRLQSEEYQLRQQALKMIYRRGGRRDIIEMASKPLDLIEDARADGEEGS
jgi:hypothetical protein